MKKYSADYFEKKYKILFDKLLQKEGFIDDIKKTRKELGLPVDGFPNGPELAFFFINKFTKDQQHSLTFIAFIRAYENEHKMRISDENRDEVIKAFMKENKKGNGMVPMMVELGELLRILMTRNIKSYKTKYKSLKLKCLNTVRQTMNIKIPLQLLFL